MPGVSVQLAATEPRFGPHSLRTPQLSPWESGSSHGTADEGCLPACLISPCYNMITAGGECMQHSPDAARSPAKGHSGSAVPEPLVLSVGREEQSWHRLSVAA